MSKVKTAFDLIKKCQIGLFMGALLEKINFIFSDRIYIQLMFYFKMGRRLNLKSPKTFNEKMQWLKLYDRNPFYTRMVDKFAVKDYIANMIGAEYVVPTFAIWDDAKEINFDDLPKQFVLKLTNGSGGLDVVICKDKEKFDKDNAVKFLKKRLKASTYKTTREWPYKNISPRIIAEKFLDNNGHVPADYKIYCFNGEPYKVMVCLDRDKDEPTKFYSFDFEWNLLRHNIRGKKAPVGFTLPKPKSLKQMYDFAKILSKNIPFVRVDFYDLDGLLYFGEMTFYPDSGFDSAILPEIDQLYGSMIDLSGVKK